MGRGLTLIEVVISAAIVSILVLAISSMNLMSLRINKSTRSRDEGFNLARGICETFRVQEISEERYNSGAVYKYINSSEDLESIEQFFENSDGVYRGQEFVSNVRNEGFIAIIEPIRLYRAMGPSDVNLELKILKVTVRENKPGEASVSLTIIR